MAGFYLLELAPRHKCPDGETEDCSLPIQLTEQWTLTAWSLSKATLLLSCTPWLEFILKLKARAAVGSRELTTKKFGSILLDLILNH